jgi:uncharacterized protein with GYD domain
MRDKGRTNRAVNALAMRVGLSVTLFLLLLGAYEMGWIAPNGIPAEAGTHSTPTK